MRTKGGQARALLSPPSPVEGAGGLKRGRLPSGCLGWLSGLSVVTPMRYYGGFPPSLVAKNVANAAPLQPTAQGSALPPSPALLPRNATRGLGGVAFLPTRIPHAKNVANASLFVGAGCPGLRFSPSPPHPPGGGCPPPVCPRAMPLLCLGGCRPVVGLGRLPSGCRGLMKALLNIMRHIIAGKRNNILIM